MSKNLKIELNGWLDEAEMIILDHQSDRLASRIVTNRNEIFNLLQGWQSLYRCDSTRLYVEAFFNASREVQKTLSNWNATPFIPDQTDDLHFLNPHDALRLMGLSRSPYRPKEIVDIQQQINQEMRAAQFRLANYGAVPSSAIKLITDLRLRKDALYGMWAQGLIG